jgi:hypothetical protein
MGAFLDSNYSFFCEWFKVRNVLSFGLETVEGFAVSRKALGTLTTACSSEKNRGQSEFFYSLNSLEKG